MKHSLMITFATASLAAGCVPSRVTYLEPSGRGYGLGTHSCAPTGEDTLSTGFAAGIFTRISSRDGAVRIEYVVPKGTRLELTSRVVSVIDRATHAAYTFEPSSLEFACEGQPSTTICGAETEAGVWIEGDTFKDGALTFASRRLYLRIGMTLDLTAFTLIPSDMIINGVRTAAEPVSFKRVTRTAWAGLCQ